MTTISPPFGDLIRTLRVSDLKDDDSLENLARIRNLRTITSYSWVDDARHGPKILVPGKPPLWTPQYNPYPLRQDSGSYFRDKNAARYPKHPTEPAVVASLAADPTLPTKLDIFACGSTFGNLLRFVRGQDRAFRMLAYKIQNTVFLVRRENSPTELIPDVRGYGHTFPEANTTWEFDVKGSISHQRLIQYTFGGLDIAVRFEADGYIKPPGNRLTKTQTNNQPTAPAPASPPGSSSSHLADLTTALSTTTITPIPTPTPTVTPKTRLTTTPAGTLVPHPTLFDLKTRSIYTRHTKDHLAEELPRLWVSQLPTLVLAFHTRGVFRAADTEVRDVRGDVARWEAEHKRDLGRLVGVLRWVRGVVGDVVGGDGDGGEAVEVCWRVGSGLDGG